MDILAKPDLRGSSAHRSALDPLPPHVLMLVGRESARNRTVAERLRRETGVTVDIVQADLAHAVTFALADRALRDGGRISVLVNEAGITFMLAAPSRGLPHAL
jgi:NAD(P)-dependent dehydrogenase (short-subunit alcohol dehydrogenase family)